MMEANAIKVFSITIRQHASLRNPEIEAIPETDWTPIPYWMDGAADVAETTYRACLRVCRLVQDPAAKRDLALAGRISLLGQRTITEDCW